MTEPPTRLARAFPLYREARAIGQSALGIASIVPLESAIVVQRSVPSAGLRKSKLRSDGAALPSMVSEQFCMALAPVRCCVDAADRPRDAPDGRSADCISSAAQSAPAQPNPGKNGTAATFTVVSATEISTAVPTGATTGFVDVTTPGGTLTSNRSFTVTP